MSGIKKIVVIGPESTGKSTLSAQLAKYFSTNFVKEYAREYLENLERAYTESDLDVIAKGQIAAEDFQLTVVEGEVSNETQERLNKGITEQVKKAAGIA